MTASQGRRNRTLGLAGLSVALGTAALADSVVLGPVKDNSMWQESGALSSGAGTHLFSGKTNLGPVRRALLAFDVAAALPAGVTVTSATLELTCTLSPAFAPGPHAFQIHRLTADWGEAGSDAGEPGGTGAPAQPGDATWTERFFGQGRPWASPGGEFAAESSATASVGECFPGAPASVIFDSTPTSVADVQAWLAEPGLNFGWILLGDEVAAPTARRLESREAPGGQPQLEIEFELPPDDVPATGPAGLALLAAALLAAATVVLLRRRRTG